MIFVVTGLMSAENPLIKNPLTSLLKSHPLFIVTLNIDSLYIASGLPIVPLSHSIPRTRQVPMTVASAGAAPRVLVILSYKLTVTNSPTDGMPYTFVTRT